MTADRPNILFIFPDQWRGDGLSRLGHPVVETPFLDELAADGTLFRHAYTNSPTCIPARACLVTGQTPGTVGRHAYRDHVPWPYRHTLMRCLRDHGYETMLAGKTHFHPPGATLGFDHLALYDTQRHTPDFRSDYDLWLAEKSDGLLEDTAQQLNSNSMIVHPWTHDEALHANSWTVTAAIDLLESRDDQRPFFLQLGFHRPHPPLDPPAEYMRRFESVDLPPAPVGDWVDWEGTRDWRTAPMAGALPARLLDRARRAYYAQLAHLDFQIGRLLRWLQLRGMADETLVIFSSDHGEHLGDHHLYHKATALEGSARVPMIVRLPHSAKAPRGQVREEPVALHDIMPTVLEAAGCPVPETVEGCSLLPLVRGGSGDSWRTHVHMEHAGSALGPWQAVTDGREKYIWNTRDGSELFFDLTADPQECRNLAADPAAADRLQFWRQRLIADIARYEADGLIADGQLRPGNTLPAYRSWLTDRESQ